VGLDPRIRDTANFAVSHAECWKGLCRFATKMAGAHGDRRGVTRPGRRPERDQPRPHSRGNIDADSTSTLSCRDHRWSLDTISSKAASRIGRHQGRTAVTLVRCTIAGPADTSPKGDVFGDWPPVQIYHGAARRGRCATVALKATTSFLLGVAGGGFAAVPK
jgi:hypothetical protein